MEALNREKSQGERGRFHYNSQVMRITVCRGYMWIEIEILLLESGLYRSLRDTKDAGSKSPFLVGVRVYLYWSDLMF